MSNLWNFLFSLSFDKNPNSYTVDELNAKLRELDLDKHLDSLEKAFEVQKIIIDKLKQENEALKRELREIKSKNNNTDNSSEESAISASASPKISYPQLKTVLCFAKWSVLGNNALESRFIDFLRRRLATNGLELELRPWGGERSVVQPLIVFFSASSQLVNDVDRILQGLQNKNCGPTILVIAHNSPDEENHPESEQLLSGFAAKSSIQLIIDIVHQNRKFNTATPLNHRSLTSLVDLLIQEASVL